MTDEVETKELVKVLRKKKIKVDKLVKALIARGDKQHEIEFHVGIRNQMLTAYGGIRDEVTRHAEYVGPDGKSSSSPKGLMLQINRLIGDLMGVPVGVLIYPEQLKAVEAMRDIAILTIQNGERMKLNRDMIKLNLYDKIKETYKHYDELLGLSKIENVKTD